MVVRSAGFERWVGVTVRVHTAGLGRWVGGTGSLKSWPRGSFATSARRRIPNEKPTSVPSSAMRSALLLNRKEAGVEKAEKSTTAAVKIVYSAKLAEPSPLIGKDIENFGSAAAWAGGGVHC